MSTHANALTIRDLRPNESDALGRPMVEVYSSLEGFPTFEEQPRYYELLAHIGAFAEKPGVRVLAAVTGAEELDFLQEGYPMLGFRRRLRAGDR